MVRFRQAWLVFIAANLLCVICADLSSLQFSADDRLPEEESAYSVLFTGAGGDPEFVSFAGEAITEDGIFESSTEEVSDIINDASPSDDEAPNLSSGWPVAPSEWPDSDFEDVSLEADVEREPSSQPISTAPPTDNPPPSPSTPVSSSEVSFEELPVELPRLPASLPSEQLSGVPPSVSSPAPLAQPLGSAPDITAPSGPQDTPSTSVTNIISESIAPALAPFGIPDVSSVPSVEAVSVAECLSQQIVDAPLSSTLTAPLGDSAEASKLAPPSTAPILAVPKEVQCCESCEVDCMGAPPHRRVHQSAIAPKLKAAKSQIISPLLAIILVSSSIGVLAAGIFALHLLRPAASMTSNVVTFSTHNLSAPSIDSADSFNIKASDWA